MERSSANSGSVTLNVSGENSKRRFAARIEAARAATCSAPRRVKSLSSWGDMENTTSRHRHAVARHRCTTARFAPRIASKVRSIMSGRAGVNTTMVTSSGILSCSISSRTNSNSAALAPG